jgi:hypothetical protein
MKRREAIMRITKLLFVVFGIVVLAVFGTGGCHEESTAEPDSADSDTCPGGGEARPWNLPFPVMNTYTTLPLPVKKVEIVRDGRSRLLTEAPMIYMSGDTIQLFFGEEMIEIQITRQSDPILSARALPGQHVET